MGVWRQTVFAVSAVLILAIVGVPTVGAGTISPDTVTRTIAVGETIVIDKVVTTDASGASFVDVFFLADNTGSMGGVITSVKSVAASLLTGLNTAFADAAFGVGRYLGDPVEGVALTSAYGLQQSITTNTANVQTAINAWFASGGGDLPEANFFALHQVATEGALTPGGVGTGSDTGWRPGAQRVIVWFGDAPSHTATISEAQTIAALTAADVTVAGLNSAGNNSGIDAGNQADNIAAATGGVVINNFASAVDPLATLLAAIGTVTETLDLSLIVSGGDTSGLTVGFSCIDALGCDDVAGGESRTLRMSLTGLTPGTYSFSVAAPGVAGAVETDFITVTGDGGGAVPEPSSLALLGIGGAFLGWLRVRRR